MFHISAWLSRITRYSRTRKRSPERHPVKYAAHCRFKTLPFLARWLRNMRMASDIKSSPTPNEGGTTSCHQCNIVTPP